MQTIHIINGPNLNLLGKREIDIYGNQSFSSYLLALKQKYPQVEINYFQSNHEGFIIDKLQEIGFSDVGIVLNAAGYTHTSIALGDSVAAIQAPVVEVHISDISIREEYRRHSYIQPNAIHFIKGKGLVGYDEAIEFLLEWSNHGAND